MFCGVLLFVATPARTSQSSFSASVFSVAIGVLGLFACITS